jgi:hypothetical protein
MADTFKALMMRETEDGKVAAAIEEIAVADLPEGARSLAAKPKRIFFSYGHDANRELVDRFKADLEARGHKVWVTAGANVERQPP